MHNRIRTRHPLAALLVAALLLTVLPGGAASASPPERGLTVVSYNIHHGVGEDGVLDLGRIADVIADSGADVAALQEVDRHWSGRSNWADQPAVLGDLLDMHVAYGANLDRDPPAPGEPRRQYGTAILSRYPIVSSQNTLLPNLGGEQRGLLEARVNVAGRHVQVASTHLQHDDATERAAQTEAIVDLLGSATEPVVLAGDLNAVPGSSEMVPIEASFTDTHGAGDGPGHTYPADDPDRRIDYVFGNDHVRPVDARVVPTLASDHLPVVAEVALTAPYADVTSRGILWHVPGWSRCLGRRGGGPDRLGAPYHGQSQETPCARPCVPPPPRSWPPPTGRSGVQQGRGNVVQRGGTRQQVEPLEHKAQFPVPRPRAGPVVEPADLAAPEPVPAGVGTTEQADDVQQGGLAGSGGAEDGDPLPFLDGQVQAGEHVEPDGGRCGRCDGCVPAARRGARDLQILSGRRYDDRDKAGVSSRLAGCGCRRAPFTTAAAGRGIAFRRWP